MFAFNFFIHTKKNWKKKKQKTKRYRIGSLFKSYSGSFWFWIAIFSWQSSHKHYSGGTGTGPPGGSEDDVDRSQRRSRRRISLGIWTYLPCLAIRMVQQLLQLSFSNQLIQMVPQISTVFRSVPLVLMILAVKALVAFQGVSDHLVWSFEEWFILNLL